MDFIRPIMASSLAFFLTMSAYAAKDPVGWSLFPTTGFPVTQEGSTSNVKYTLTNNLPKAATIVTKLTHHGGSFRTVNNCNNQSLAPGASCTIIIAFSPSSAGTGTVQLTYGYHNNRIPLPGLTATATGHASSEIVHGSIKGLPPAFTLSNPEQQPIFTIYFTNTGSSDITGFANPITATPSTVATVTTLSSPANTCGSSGSPVTIRPGDSCSITAQLTPNSLGQVTVSDTFTYDSGKTTTVSASSHVINGNSTCSIHGYASLPLPSNTYRYADNDVQFTFENECTTGSATLGQVNLTSTLNATITTNSTYDLCSNQTIPGGGSCTITASVIPQGTGDLIVDAVVASGGGEAEATTSATVASNIQSQHHILFINQCPFTVWYGIANGDGSDCPGTKCKTPDPNLVTYPNGAPPSAYQLNAQVAGAPPATIDLALSSYQNGALWPRTGCVMQNGNLNCATGTCGTLNNSGTCSTTKPPLQPQNPFTKFEPYIVSTPGGDGVYDVSAINGMTVPVEMKAFGPPTGNTASTVYNCSGAGAIIQPSYNNALGACSWNYNPASTLSGISNVNNDFYWVTPGPDDACCTGGSCDISCGMAYNTGPSALSPVSGAPINRRNGNFLGFNPLANDTGYSADTQWGSVNLFRKYDMGTQIINQSTSSNYGFQVNTSYNNTTTTYNTYLQLLECVPDTSATSGDSANSCYQNKLTAPQFAQCCGCINWPNTLPAFDCGNGSPNYINGENFDWTTFLVPSDQTTNPGSVTYTIGNAIRWIKNACPTAYAYQFDDATSSFQCTHDGSTPLLTSYEITFCPGGVTGLPAGATEGRSTPPS